ncbi:MAG: hypothetical protein KAU50_06520 [Candidatus Marinimicrobia bacterium]|nr:hypothetical protein [Candidatus Neomarinimicrobiota bacterium]
MQDRSSIEFKTIRIIPLIILFFATLISNLAGQHWSASVSTQVGHGDNLFESNLVGEQFVTDGRVNLAYYPADNLRVTGAFARSEVLTDGLYSYSWWSGGIQWRKLDNDRHHFYSGLSYTGRRYSDYYSYYDHGDLGAYFEWKYSPLAQRSLKLGYDLQARSFPEEAQASNTVHRGYALLTQSFNSGTALRLGGNLSYQDFWSPPLMAGRGRGFVGIPLYEELPSNIMIDGSFRVSQSLHSRVGLALQTDWQRRLNRDASGANYLDGLDNPFVDRFRWDGYGGSAQLTVILPWQITAATSADYRIRDYIDVPVYLYDFGLNEYVLDEDSYVISHQRRRERRFDYQIRLSRSWYLPISNKFDTLGSSLTFGWNRNRSNDPLYDSSGGFITVGLQINMDK